MKKLFILLGIIILVLGVAFWGFKTWTKSHSPQTTTTFKTDDLEIKVSYSQPQKKGREIFGGLVPYGKVWRTGANEATTITFEPDVVVAGKPLASGTYTLWTIPDPNQWTIIFNKETGQWGTNYDEKQDVLRVSVPTATLPSTTENFTITIKSQSTGADIHLIWDQTDIIVPVKLQ
ncbi:DUF2911 domain-containing protein [Cytophagaceae bacterium YF14B1]|uniref:DUF2911 domain-containing protein n=1 Tax=Xanthocytophaga flava TaxID=3048013 RepID=A0AAE3QT83_9BACT|nr:DUF2911 domain-containing protein [Xanthocytophaga flavus]MDJ1484506.1 DUF2911 domain-containing protein [Xanthocytophaga flavus]